MKKIASDENFEAILTDEYILVKDKSTANLGSCLIYPKKHERFNYAISNFVCMVKEKGSDYKYLKLLAPLHFLPELLETQNILEDHEYEFTSNKTELIEFYQDCGYEVVDNGNTLQVKDPIGRIRKTTDDWGVLFEVNDFDEVVQLFEITLNEGKISFEILK